MDEIKELFDCLDEEDIELLLKNIDTPADKELSRSVKKRLSIKEQTSIRAFPLKTVLPFAAAFIIVFAFTLGFGIKNGLLPSAQPPVTTVTTTEQPPEYNPLMEAISTGDDDIIQKLLSVPGVITKETLDFALNFSNLLSYDTLHQIAVSVRDSLGATGLDGLVEAALMGDSQKVITELDIRKEMTMNPFEKLAFFFSVAFCDSETVEKFVSRGYDINMKDASGNSIYAIAEKYGNEDTMQYAISMGITS